MQQTLGNIRANRMIYTQTLLIPASLIFCYFNTTIHDRIPSVVEIAKTYPNCIVFRVGMLYSMFMLFLQTLFIHWWIATEKDRLQIKSGVNSSFPLGLVAVVSYALFASCIDTKRMNYTLIEYSCFVADLSFTLLIQVINRNIKTIVAKNPHFVTGQSWRYKKILGSVNLGLFVVGVLIYFGRVSISYKDVLEYATIINVVLYFATFVLDFKKKYMGVDINDWGVEGTANQRQRVQQPQVNQTQELVEPMTYQNKQRISHEEYVRYNNSQLLSQSLRGDESYHYPAE